MWVESSERMNFVVCKPVQLSKKKPSNNSCYVSGHCAVFIVHPHESDNPGCFEPFQMLSFFKLLPLFHCHQKLQELNIRIYVHLM